MSPLGADAGVMPTVPDGSIEGLDEDADELGVQSDSLTSFLQLRNRRHPRNVFTLGGQRACIKIQRNSTGPNCWRTSRGIECRRANMTRYAMLPGRWQQIPYRVSHARTLNCGPFGSCGERASSGTNPAVLPGPILRQHFMVGPYQSHEGLWIREGQIIGGTLAPNVNIVRTARTAGTHSGAAPWLPIVTQFDLASPGSSIRYYNATYDVVPEVPGRDASAPPETVFSCPNLALVMGPAGQQIVSRTTTGVAGATTTPIRRVGWPSATAVVIGGLAVGATIVWYYTLRDINTLSQEAANARYGWLIPMLKQGAQRTPGVTFVPALGTVASPRVAPGLQPTDGIQATKIPNFDTDHPDYRPSLHPGTVGQCTPARAQRQCRPNASNGRRTLTRTYHNPAACGDLPGTLANTISVRRSGCTAWRRNPGLGCQPIAFRAREMSACYEGRALQEAWCHTPDDPGHRNARTQYRALSRFCARELILCQRGDRSALNTSVRFEDERRVSQAHRQWARDNLYCR